MQKLKYLLVVIFTVFAASFIVWQQSQQLWRGVSSYMVENQAGFIQNQIVKLTEKNIHRMQKQINKIIHRENSAQRINPTQVGVSNDFRDSQLDGLAVLASRNGEYYPLWKVMQPGIQTQWSEYFFDKTWRKAMAEAQKYDKLAWTYFKDPKQKGFWTVAYKVSIPEISTSELIVVAVVPKIALIDFSIDLQSGFGEFILVNSEKVTLVHSNGDYTGGTVVYKDLQEANYSLGRQPIKKVVHADNGKEMLLNFVPLTFTNLNLIVASPVYLSSTFIEGLISSVFLYFIYLLIVSSALILIFPTPFKEKYEKLIESLRAVVNGHFALTDSVAREIPEAITSLQEISNNYGKSSVASQPKDSDVTEASNPKKSGVSETSRLPAQDVEQTQEVELDDFEPTAELATDYFEINEKDLSEEVLNNKKMVSVVDPTPSPNKLASTFVTDISMMVNTVLSELEAVIMDSGATVKVYGFKEDVKNEDILTRIKLPLKSILMNAIEAVNSVDKKLIEVSGEMSKDGNYKITVKDSGCGLKQNDAGRVFEPFYTTKDSELHPGLGLTAAKNQLKDLVGTIELVSVDSGGVEAVILLPVSQQKQKIKPTLSKSSILNEPLRSMVDEDADEDEDDEFPLMMASPEGSSGSMRLDAFKVSNNIDFPSEPKVAVDEDDDDYGDFQVKPTNKIND